MVEPPIAPVKLEATSAELIDQYFPADARPTATAIMMAESSGNSWAVGHNTNGTTDSGLFQINSIHADRVNGDLSSLLDPETNVRVASEIYREQGFSPWVTYWTGRYLQYLK